MKTSILLRLLIILSLWAEQGISLAAQSSAINSDSAPSQHNVQQPGATPNLKSIDTAAFFTLDRHHTSNRVLKIDLTRDANDIWDRIRRGFAIPDIDSPLVTQWQGFYLNRRKHLESVFERGGQYLYYIVAELERRNMPTELALLPMVESSYNPLAVSPSKASGLWQFIPSTGRVFKLQQNNWVDERRDVIASTNAALHYLEYLYEMHGDWQLAITSYNWGEGSVLRAIKKNEAKQLPTHYLALEMPEQPLNYIPKLQALKNIVLNPELFDFELPFVANDEHFTTVKVPKGIDLKTAAKFANTDFDTIVALNPAYQHNVVHRDDAQLAIPSEQADAFRLCLTNYSPQPLKEITPASPRKVKTHKVKPGDTLYQLSRKYKISLKSLRQKNKLGRKTIIRPGQKLLIPMK